MEGVVRPAAAAAAVRIDPYKYFKIVFGFNESIEDVYARIACEQRGEDVVLSAPTGLLRVGRFRVVSVNELRAEAALLPPSQRRGTFSLIVGNGIRSRNFADVDVGAVQMAPGNRGALFQVASNFNCLEFISSSDSARRGITKYVSDHTQGPAASISCAPATLFRNYFVPHRGEDGTERRGQLEEQICLLRDVPQVPVKNGYVKFTRETLARLHEQEDFDFDEAVGRVRVGLQLGAQVTSGMKTHELVMCTDPEQHVSQIFSAAMDLGGWGNPDDDPMVIQSACMLLRASYEATVLAARINAARPDGQPLAFLTLMGGGVFHNHPAWIADAILAQRDAIVASGVDFRLILFNSGERELGNAAFSRLASLVGTTGGAIVQA